MEKCCPCPHLFEELLDAGGSQVLILYHKRAPLAPDLILFAIVGGGGGGGGGRAEKKFTYDDWAVYLVETHGD